MNERSPRISIELTKRPIDSGALAPSLPATDGALVTFSGVVRGSDGDRQVTRLEYEAYEEVAKKGMQEIASEACARWPVGTLSMVHRVGRLEVGETSVLVAVSTPHRAEAFEACRFCIDSLKQRVAIWKKEILASGESQWLGKVHDSV